ncbi:MAG: GntR family transcriptional regulator, partial [Pseudomonadota bacterium]
MTDKASAIVSAVTQAILDHNLVPGTKLGERELAEIFGSSRVIVRQALVELSDGGLVSLQRNRGAFVAVRPQDVKQGRERVSSFNLGETCSAG